jgi:hypothetical protein
MSLAMYLTVRFNFCGSDNAVSSSFIPFLSSMPQRGVALKVKLKCFQAEADGLTLYVRRRAALEAD